MSAHHLIALDQLEIRTPERALVSGLQLDVFSGQVTAVMGPSGSGKSLTARAVMGWIEVAPGLTQGSLRYPALDPQKDWFEGVRGGGVGAQARLLKQTAPLRGAYFTYAPQAASSALNPGRTLGRQLELAMSRRQTPVSAQQSATVLGGLLEEVGLPLKAAGMLPGEMSGGMCQRAALAIAMAAEPKVLIADEPETGLDPVLTRVVIELMLKVCQRRGCGLLLISHHEDTVERIADRVVRLPGGGKHP